MRIHLKLPIIVSESGDVMIFKSAEDAECYLESPDVRSNRYVAYDAEGLPLKIVAADSQLGGWTGGSAPVRIYESESGPMHINEAMKVLKDVLLQLGESEKNLTDQSLETLLEMSIGRLGYTQ